MRVHIGGDHAAYDLKLHLVQHLLAHGHDVVDHGPDHYDPETTTPWPSCAAAEAVSGAPGQLGIVLGARQRRAIAANKVPASGPHSRGARRRRSSADSTTMRRSCRSGPG